MTRNYNRQKKITGYTKIDCAEKSTKSDIIKYLTDKLEDLLKELTAVKKAAMDNLKTIKKIEEQIKNLEETLKRTIENEKNIEKFKKSGILLKDKKSKENTGKTYGNSR